MSKSLPAAIASAAMLATLIPVAALPTAAAAQSRSNGVTSCDAPGGRQQAGALIGAVLGGVIGSNVARNERTWGTVGGAAAGAAAGSYIGCNQQRARANAQATTAANTFRATSNLRVRSGPGTSYPQIGSVGRGQTVEAVGSQGEWVRITGGGWVSANYLTY